MNAVTHRTNLTPCKRINLALRDTVTVCRTRLDLNLQLAQLMVKADVYFA